MNLETPKLRSSYGPAQCIAVVVLIKALILFTLFCWKHHILERKFCLHFQLTVLLLSHTCIDESTFLLIFII